MIPESAEVQAERQERERRVYGEGWETGEAKTWEEEARDSQAMMGVCIVVCVVLVGTLIGAFVSLAL